MKNKLQLLPLLQTLMGMTPAQRTVVVAHLDTKSQDMLIDTIDYVLRMGRQKLPKDKAAELSEVLSEHKDDLRYVCDRKRPIKSRRKRMQQIGGFPIGLVLSTALPLLLNLLKK